MSNPIIKRIEETDPALWAACYPRLYRNCERYGSTKVPAAVHATTLHWIRRDYQNAPGTSQNIYLALCVQQQYQQPLLFVAPELLAALNQTKPPADLLWDDIQLPFEAGVLMLPRGALKHPTDGNVDFLGWGRLRAGQPRRWADDWPRIASDADLFVVYTGLADNPDLPLLDTVLNGRTAPHIGDTYQPDITLREGIFDLPVAADENEFLQQCRTLVFGVLLGIEARPTLLTTGKRLNTHAKSGREIWLPNIIGQNYRVIRTSESGTHASPRTHWRRGHFRRQPFGTGRTESKTIWIEPTLIG